MKFAHSKTDLLVETKFLFTEQDLREAREMGLNDSLPNVFEQWVKRRKRFNETQAQKGKEA